ncbi:MAG: 2-C-methyl-D-erythritol 2,4-cyclodiphosphate synthase [Bacteroidales bacterium]|jgi:2-C-methyl-D-erythritol 2,4-cyclodiphosphate synthase|nr:2-C-methyl-D-erythritol 2,4-cyclodiphosphate synthase [Bacteroidales bacterium]
MDYRVGTGYDSHRLVQGRALVLGGVHIPFAKGCHAHSDGDAVIHALCDALLGAAALPDIGQQFPDTNMLYQDISSLTLLEKTVALLQKSGWQIHNADLTIVLQVPKLAPYLPAMKQQLCPLLKIPDTALSIKAKTNEFMGFTGSSEGVAAIAVALLETIQ